MLCTNREPKAAKEVKDPGSLGYSLGSGVKGFGSEVRV